jgi:hypothetical protein
MALVKSSLSRHCRHQPFDSFHWNRIHVVRYSAPQTVLFNKNVRAAVRNPTSVSILSQGLGWYRNGSLFPPSGIAVYESETGEGVGFAFGLTIFRDSDFNHFWIKRSIRRSATGCSTNFVVTGRCLSPLRRLRSLL